MKYLEGRIGRRDILVAAGSWTMWNSLGQYLPHGVPSLSGNIAADDAVDANTLAKLRALSLTPDEALGAGESVAIDASPAIRRILAAGRPLRIPPGAVYRVKADPASDIGGGGFSYAVKIPSNAVLFWEGGTIKLEDNAPNWCRAVSFEGANNVRSYGALRVDGNASKVAHGNEHMHGVFLYNTTNFYIEAIEARNCFGDGVYIGGTDNTRGSCDGVIGRIVSVTAGRKCLVGQAFDNVHIGSVWLDNSLGGSLITGKAADTTDGNCLDIEPDSCDGSVKSRLWINQLYTKGAGNDLTAGTSLSQAESMHIYVGKWVCDIVPRAGVPWHTQYAISLHVDDFIVSGITAISATAEFYYAARLFAKRMTLQGARADATTPFMLTANVGGNQPKLVIDHLSISGLGVGFENRDGHTVIGNYKARTGGIAFWNRALGGPTPELIIGTLDMEDVGQPLGAGYGFLVTKDPNMPTTRIDHIRFRDRRVRKLNYVGYLGPGVCPGFVIGGIDNNTAVSLFGYDGSDNSVRRAGVDADCRRRLDRRQ